jgi:hypothetical protein
VLTKYSTEYNNFIFIYNLAQTMNMDKKDLLAFFQEMRLFNKHAEDESILENYNITKLDVRRMYRYLDKNVKKENIDDEMLEEFE